MWHMCSRTLVRCAALLLLSSALAVSHPALGDRDTKASASQPAYIYMDMDSRGSYKYAYDAGNGNAGAQTANEANEVSGHYTYQEGGVPYRVNYKAGVQGFQAEVQSQPMAPAMQQQFARVFAGAGTHIKQHKVGLAAGEVLEVMQPLQFVEQAMRTIGQQPLQISFSTQQIMHQQQQQQQKQQQENQRNPQQQHYQQQHQLHDPTKTVVIAKPTRTALSQSEASQINALAANVAVASSTVPVVAEVWPRRPFSFAYDAAGQSTHSASADSDGTVVGKYSYHDEAGYHELTYKAGDHIGFQVIGGNLVSPDVAGTHKNANGLSVASATTATALLHANAAAGQAGTGPATHHVPLLVVNVAQEPNVKYSYTLEEPSVIGAAVGVRSGSSDNANRNGRSLRKFRRYANW